MELQERYRGSLLGLAVGAALGAILEGSWPGSFPPLEDMGSGGPFHLNLGEWTDDTSMALCLATSLVERQDFDVHDQMERYLRCLKEGYMCSTGRYFGLAGRCSPRCGALSTKETQKIVDRHSASIQLSVLTLFSPRRALFRHQ